MSIPADALLCTLSKAMLQAMVPPLTALSMSSQPHLRDSVSLCVVLCVRWHRCVSVCMQAALTSRHVTLSQGRVRAICAGMNLAEVRVLGMQQAGFKCVARCALWLCGVSATHPRDAFGCRGRDLTVFTGSWNVGETTPPADPTTLAEWLRPGEYDVYAITLQECDHKDEWAAAIASLLDPTSTPAVKKKKNVFKRVGKLLKRSSLGARLHGRCRACCYAHPQCCVQCERRRRSRPRVDAVPVLSSEHPVHS